MKSDFTKFFIHAGVLLIWFFSLTFEALIEAGSTLLQITLRVGGLAQRRKVMSCSGSSGGGAKSIGNLRHRLLEVAPHQGLDIVIVVVERKSEIVNK